MDQDYERGPSSATSSNFNSSEEELGFISEKSKPQYKKTHGGAERLRSLSVRAAMEAILGILVFILLMVIAAMNTGSQKESPQNKHKVATFGPSLPEKVVQFGNVAGFGPDLVYVDHEMLYNATHKRELHENWQKLYPKSRGYIKSTSEPGDTFEYANPAYHLENFPKQGDHYEGYILSVFHQLHCLSVLTSRLGTSYEEFAQYTRPQLEHTTHCIEYLRQAILCAGDTALEGETGSWPASAAWGQKHTCKDYDALIALADARGMWDLSDSRHPDIHKIHPDPKETEGKYGGD